MVRKMKEFEYTVTDAVGLHARPAGMLVKEAKKYTSRITLFANGKQSDATRLMTLMAMCIKCGTPVRVTVEGDDEAVCAEALQSFFENNL